MTEKLAAALAEVVRPAHVLTDPDMTASYAVDWTGRFRGEARLVVSTGDAGEVAEVVRRCAESGAEVVPQGGNTGPRRRSVPRWRPMVVLSTCRLERGSGPVDDGALQVTAGAGGTLARWREPARARAWMRPSTSPAGIRRRSAGRWRRTPAVPGSCRSARAIAGRRVSAVLAAVSTAFRSATTEGGRSGCTSRRSCAAARHAGRAHRRRLRVVPLVQAHGEAMVTTAGLDEAVAVLAHLRLAVTHLDAVELILPEDDGRT